MWSVKNLDVVPVVVGALGSVTKKLLMDNGLKNWELG